ncbi:CrcB family protein [Nocardioides sp. InS609-2]|uniref:fluoride efflux transporter FluC n=1 Tax=Nocardioides sp. InS609-2 TaxID=2760705 RepID=UPI0020BE678F|nr:CrcB family protein [Nocardioides sp. InS609-2]
MSEERFAVAGLPSADENRAGEQRPTDTEHGSIDPDVDLGLPRQRREWTAHRWVLPTISAGGMLGASARHGLEIAWAAGAGGFPWATFVTNVGGCALIGLLMVYVVEVGAGHPLLRPFVGVGILGGFTTFSTYTVQTTGLLDSQEPALALVYLFGTIAAALAAVIIGVVLGRVVLALLRRRARRARARQARAGKGGGS